MSSPERPASPAGLLARATPATRAALGVFAVALAVRLVWVAAVDSPFDNIFSDMGGYVNRALQAAYGKGDPYPIFVTMYPPGAHFIYAAQMRLVGWTNHAPFLLLHCLWGAAVAPCATLLSLRVVPRLPVAVAVGLVVAVWDPLLSFTGYFSSEQMYAGLLALSAWLLVRQIETGRGAVLVGATTALAYLVRPQILLTVAGLGAAWLVGLALRKRWARVRVIPVVIASAVVASAVVFGAVRYHDLTGRAALISDNGAMARLFADTSYGKVKSIMSGPDGEVIGEFFFAPPAKGQTGENREFAFRGYLGEPGAVEAERRREVARMSLRERVLRWEKNVTLLFVHNSLWPESTHLGDGWREALADASKAALLAIVCPLALLGLTSAATRPTPALAVVSAHVLTSLVVAAFFYGEIRYRVPYDVFLILLALEGARAVAPWLAAQLRSASPEGERSP